MAATIKSKIMNVVAAPEHVTSAPGIQDERTDKEKVIDEFNQTDSNGK